jgi:choline dehydrogenase-like flavoprotein
MRRHRLATLVATLWHCPADHLKSAGVPVVHDLPGVGSNMQDHLDLFVIAECNGRPHL